MSTLMTLLSDEYREQLLKMRAPDGPNPHWGKGGGIHFPVVRKLLASRPDLKTVVDYGCGKGLLLRSLVSVGDVAAKDAQFYDPGIPEHAALPRPADLLISTDVLEHIEPEHLDDVLTHIRQLTKKVAYLLIAVAPAKAVLPDGRNAHLIVQPPAWWKAKLEQHFTTVTESRVRDGYPHPTFTCE